MSLSVRQLHADLGVVYTCGSYIHYGHVQKVTNLLLVRTRVLNAKANETYNGQWQWLRVLTTYQQVRTGVLIAGVAYLW